ncbi:MAG: hypothetical protein ABW221_06690 [Vicinamibacteria bacterium]
MEAIGWVLGGLAALVAALEVRRRRGFVRRGYDASPHFRDEVRYVERAPDGSSRQIVLGGEMLVGAPNVIEVPSDDRWDAEMPGWAKGRKREILDRVLERLGRDRYVIEERTADPAGRVVP